MHAPASPFKAGREEQLARRSPRRGHVRSVASFLNIPNDKAKATAAVWGSTELGKVLLDRKASINPQDEDGKFALTWAAQYRSTELGKELLDCNTSINLQSKRGVSALMYAAQEDLQMARSCLTTASASSTSRGRPDTLH